MRNSPIEYQFLEETETSPFFVETLGITGLQGLAFRATYRLERNFVDFLWLRNEISSAMRNVGDIFDFAINNFGIPADDFVMMFISSDVCLRMENGEAKYLVGMSGIELAMAVIEEKTGMLTEPKMADGYFNTPDYWCGWALCYYQWLRQIPYKRIFRAVTNNDIRAMYPTLHEADVSKFADAMDGIIRKTGSDTRLKQIKSARGYSQSELAKQSGVTLRSIQMYEQLNKDINRGRSETILRLAHILGCSMEELLEPIISK